MAAVGWFLIVMLSTFAGLQASLRIVWDWATRVALWLLPEPMAALPDVDTWSEGNP